MQANGVRRAKSGGTTKSLRPEIGEGIFLLAAKIYWLAKRRSNDVRHSMDA
jgi:hypothetical protein